MVNRAREGGSEGTGRGRATPATALFALALFASVAAASGLSDIPAAFVDVGIGAREMGMAGASVASTSGPTAVFWNPARLADPAAGSGVALTHGEQMGLVPYSAAAGSWRAGANWVIGAGSPCLGCTQPEFMSLPFYEKVTDVQLPVVGAYWQSKEAE